MTTDWCLIVVALLIMAASFGAVFLFFLGWKQAQAERDKWKAGYSELVDALNQAKAERELAVKQKETVIKETSERLMEHKGFARDAVGAMRTLVQRAEKLTNGDK